MPSSGGQKCALDRKSTRLNSSHGSISYAVFCLTKKTTRLIPLRCPAHLRQAPTRAEHVCTRGGDVRRPHGRTEPRAGRSAVVGAFFFLNKRAPPEITPLPLPGPLPI